MRSENTRRTFICASAAVGTGLVISACGGRNEPQSGKQAGGESRSKGDEREEGGEVTATEDLMREHGILRRALLVYTAAANTLRANPASVPPAALQKTARLFRAFGEDYHEKKLVTASTISTGNHIVLLSTPSIRNPASSNARRMKIGRQSRKFGKCLCVHS